jgi:ABC-type amino acid transport substrate-binding protein
VEPHAEHGAVIFRSAFAVLVLLGVLSPLSATEPVSVSIPLSLQPYFIPYSGEGLAYETLIAAFAARDRRVQPFYLSQRKNNINVLAAYPQLDCAVHQTQESSKGWYTVEEVYPLHYYAISLAAKALELDDVEDLKDLNVIGYLGASRQLGSDFAETVRSNSRYREIHNHRAQVQMLLKERVQVIVVDRLLAEWYLGYLADESGRHVDVKFHDLFEPVPLHFACRNQELVEVYNAGLEEIRSSGKLEAIRARYGSD